MTYKHLKFSIEDKVAVITLNRPKFKNAFSMEMLESWADAIHKSHEDPKVNVVILTGEGESFCAGGDIKHFLSRDLTPWDFKNFLQDKVHPIARAVEKLDKPLIAAVNGPAYGAGMDMALMCDMRIASDKAEFCESYIKLGVAAGDGGAFLLPRLVGIAKAMEWLLTANPIDAEEALRFGLVNRVVPHAKLMDETLSMANKIANYSPLGVRTIKKAVYQGLSSNLSDHLEYISSQMGLLIETDYYKKAVEAFIKNSSRKK
jgi:enoyl-CoA hydratase/carnithine racemase